MRTIDISHRTIIFTVFFLLGLWILWEIKDIILLLFVAFLIATALEFPMAQLSRLRIPRPVVIILMYIILFAIIAGFAVSVVPPLIDQTSHFVNNVPRYLSELGINVIDQKALADQVATLGELPVNLFRFATSVLSNVINVIAVLVLAFYLLLERAAIDRRLRLLFGDDANRTRDVLSKVELKLGRWVRGELILMTIIAITTYVGLRLLDVQFALPLAILAGVLEIVPNVGPVVAAAPAILVGFTVSPVLGLSVAALYFLIQQLENIVVVPKVMQASVGISPLVTLVALGIGAKLGGIMGAILAIPVFLVVQVLVTEFFKGKVGKLL